MFSFLKNATVLMATNFAVKSAVRRTTKKYRSLLREQRERLKLERNILLTHKEGELNTLKKENSMLRDKIKRREELYYRTKVQLKQNKRTLAELELWVEKVVELKSEVYSGFRSIKDQVDRNFIAMQKSEGSIKAELSEVKNPV